MYGERIQRVRAEQWPDGLPTGQAVATTAGRLPARWVIHTVGPVYAKSEDRSQLLASCQVEIDWGNPLFIAVAGALGEWIPVPLM